MDKVTVENNRLLINGVDIADNVGANIALEIHSGKVLKIKCEILATDFELPSDIIEVTTWGDICEGKNVYILNE